MIIILATYINIIYINVLGQRRHVTWTSCSDPPRRQISDGLSTCIGIELHEENVRESAD